MSSSGSRRAIAILLSSWGVGKHFTIPDLYLDGSVPVHPNTSRRLRELREVGWVLPYKNGRYCIEVIGAMPEDEEWGAGRKVLSKRVRRLVFERSGYKCQVCGLSPALSNDVRLTVGHIIPVSAGGLDEEENLRTECSDCNEPWRDFTYDKHKRLEELSRKYSDFKLPEVFEEDLAELVLLLMSVQLSHEAQE